MLKIASTSNLLQYWLQYHLMIQPCTKRTAFEVWPWRDRPWHWMSQDNLLREYHYTERWAAKRTDNFYWYASINAFIIHSVAIIMLFILLTKNIRRDWIVGDCEVPSIYQELQSILNTVTKYFSLDIRRVLVTKKDPQKPSFSWILKLHHQPLKRITMKYYSWLKLNKYARLNPAMSYCFKNEWSMSFTVLRARIYNIIMWGMYSLCFTV